MIHIKYNFGLLITELFFNYLTKMNREMQLAIFAIVEPLLGLLGVKAVESIMTA